MACKGGLRELQLIFPSKIAKEIFKVWKTSGGYDGNGISECRKYITILRISEAEKQGDDLISFAFDMIKDELLSLGMSLFVVDRILPRKLSRDEFDIWLKKMKAKSIIESWRQNPIITKDERLVIGQCGELVTEKKTVKKKRDGYINEYFDTVEIEVYSGK